MGRPKKRETYEDFDPVLTDLPEAGPLAGMDGASRSGRFLPRETRCRARRLQDWSVHPAISTT